MTEADRRTKKPKEKEKGKLKGKKQTRLTLKARGFLQFSLFVAVGPILHTEALRPLCSLDFLGALHNGLFNVIATAGNYLFYRL